MTNRSWLLALLMMVGVVGIGLQSGASPQTSPQTPPPRRPPAELLRLSRAAETPGLAEPFRGVTTNGRVEPGLFGIRSTGVSRSRCAGQPRGFWPDSRQRSGTRHSSLSMIRSGASG